MSTNGEFAKIFDDFAKILELKRGDRFKILAYERAAQAIGAQGEQLKSIFERGGIKELEEIEGIGEGIAGKIAECLKTGKIKEFEKLKRGISPIELEVLDLPGIGPKTAQKIFSFSRSRNISTLKTELRKNGHKIFSEKTLTNIMRSLDLYRKKGPKRMLLVEAEPIANRIIKYLEESAVLKNVVVVGSLRRAKETVGDIDLIAVSANSQKAIKKFVEFREFDKIVNRGKAKSTVIHESGAQIDLEIMKSEEYGSLLQHFTGSREHNIALRTYAQGNGMSISEHGIKFIKTGRTKKCATEEEVYKTLGMNFIAPELRENRGEIEASLLHNLPKLVELKDIKGDLHVHSNYSDGDDSIEEIVKKALNLGYWYVAISDHTVGLGIARGLSPKRFSQRQKEIEFLRKKFPKIKIISSCEVNIRSDGTLDMPDSAMKNFDIVNASVHSSFNQSKDAMTQRIIKAVSNDFVDIIGHPTGRILNKRDGYEADWPKIFGECAKQKVALEINAYPDRLDLTDALVFEARKMGVKFAISTDAHNVNQMDNMIYGVSVARRGWCEKKDIINASDFHQKK